MPIGLMILCCIAGLLLLLLIGSITLYVSYDEKISLRAGIWGIKIWIISPDQPKKAKKEKKKVSSQEKKTAQKVSKRTAKKKKVSPKKVKTEAAEKKKALADDKKKDLWETIYLVLDLVKAVCPPLGKLLKRIRITHLQLSLSVGKEDADATAISYGEMNGALYYSLAALQQMMTVKVKKWEIHADFVTGETVWKYYFRVKLRVCVILWAAICMLFRFLGNTIKRNDENTKHAEAAAKQTAPERSAEKRKKDGAVS